MKHISTLSFELPILTQIQGQNLDQWIRTLLWEGNLLGIGSSHQRISVHRTKGRIVAENGEEWILQGVGEVYEMKKIGEMATELQSKIVLIGEGLQAETIKKSLAYTLALDTEHSK